MPNTTTPSQCAVLAWRHNAGLAREGWARSRHDDDPNRCFYGDRSDPARPWSGGYSLGYELVRRYLATRGMTASEAATLSAEEAWPVLAPILVLVPILETLAVEQRNLHWLRRERC